MSESGKENSSAPVQPERSILRIHHVAKRTGLSKTSIRTMAARGDFPKPIPLGLRMVGWVESEVTEWVDQRVRERDEIARAE